MPQKVIIDTDIGTYYDDALAVSVGCQSPELELLGVTTAYGDTHLRSRIARKVLDINGRPDVPVARGVGQPLQGNYLMFGFEGEGILEEGDGDLAYLDEPAPNFIIRNIMENPGEVTVVTLGAVSNMAVAYVMEPAIRENIKELIMMAGVIVPIVDEKGVRRSPVEEYNFNNDPVAAQIVCNSGLPMVLCPIDVTLKVPLRDDQLATINASDRPVAQMVSRILAVWPPQERQIYLSVGIPTEHTGPLAARPAGGDAGPRQVILRDHPAAHFGRVRADADRPRPHRPQRHPAHHPAQAGAQHGCLRGRGRGPLHGLLHRADRQGRLSSASPEAASRCTAVARWGPIKPERLIYQVD